ARGAPPAGEGGGGGRGGGAGAPRGPAAGGGGDRAGRAPPAAPVPPGFAVARHVVALRRVDAVTVRPPLPAIPPRGVLLVGSAELARALAGPAREVGAVILSTDPATPPELAQVIRGLPAAATGALAPL